MVLTRLVTVYIFPILDPHSSCHLMIVNKNNHKFSNNFKAK